MIRESSSFLMAKAFVDNALAMVPDDHFSANIIIIDAYQNGREQGLALNISTSRTLNDFPLADQPVVNRALLHARSYFAEPMEHNGPHSPSRQFLPSSFTLYIAKGRHIDAIVGVDGAYRAFEHRIETNHL